MKSILITGCNRGLGLGLVRHFLKSPEPPSHLIATCRNKDKAKELLEVAESNQNVHILEVDVSKPEDFDRLKGEVEGILKDGSLNVLVNNAGVSPRSTKINMVTAEQMIDTFVVNTVGPLMLTKALLPLLRTAASKNPDQPMGPSRAAVVNMTSILGSLEMNKEGGIYPYRCSKAALNMVTASLARDLHRDGILVVAVHPGWVKTDMGGPKAPLDVDGSTEAIVRLIGGLGAKQRGRFLQWDGKEVAW